MMTAAGRLSLTLAALLGCCSPGLSGLRFPFASDTSRYVGKTCYVPGPGRIPPGQGWEAASPPLLSVTSPGPCPGPGLPRLIEVGRPPPVFPRTKEG